jgi:predicted nucleic-acid-binding Zn-ribbon protein
MVDKVRDNKGNDVLIIYSEEIEALTISNKTKKVRVYCKPCGYFEFHFKKKVFNINNNFRFDFKYVKN